VLALKRENMHWAKRRSARRSGDGRSGQRSDRAEDPRRAGLGPPGGAGAGSVYLRAKDALWALDFLSFVASAGSCSRSWSSSSLYARVARAARLRRLGRRLGVDHGDLGSSDEPIEAQTHGSHARPRPQFAGQVERNCGYESGPVSPAAPASALNASWSGPSNRCAGASRSHSGRHSPAAAMVSRRVSGESWPVPQR